MQFTILVIENEPAVQALIAAALPEFLCVFADRLSGAFGILDANGIDLVILDLGLPTSTGGETVMRYLEHKPVMPPAIICSGFCDPADVFRYQKAGIAGFIGKPPEDIRHLPDLITGAIARGQYVKGLHGTISDLKRAHKKRRSKGEWAAIAVGVLAVAAAIIALFAELIKASRQ